MAARSDAETIQISTLQLEILALLIDSRPKTFRGELIKRATLRWLAERAMVSRAQASMCASTIRSSVGPASRMRTQTLQQALIHLCLQTKCAALSAGRARFSVFERFEARHRAQRFHLLHARFEQQRFALFSSCLCVLSFSFSFHSFPHSACVCVCVQVTTPTWTGQAVFWVL